MASRRGPSSHFPGPVAACVPEACAPTPMRSRCAPLLTLALLPALALLLTLALLLATAPPARAVEAFPGYGWGYSSNEDGPSLVLGSTETTEDFVFCSAAAIATRRAR